MGLLDSATTVAEDPGPWSTMIYGDYGAGKTVFGCQADGALLLDCEKSRRSLLNHEELLSTPIIKCNSLTEVRAVVPKLKNDKDERIKTLVVDTVTTLQFNDLNAIMKKVFQDNKSRDPDLPSQAEFNRNNRRISRFCREMIDACAETNRNVIFLAHIKEEKDDEGSTTLIRPGTSPALTQAIAPMVDSIFYLAYTADSHGVVKRTLHVVATKKIKGKNRFGNLPATIENPHFSMIEKAADEQRQKAIQLQLQQQEQDKTNASD